MPGNYTHDCQVVFPPGSGSAAPHRSRPPPTPTFDPGVVSPTGLSHATPWEPSTATASAAQAMLGMPTTAASTAAAVGALTLDLPLCPPGYHFNYDYQACFADGSPARRIPAGQMYKYACRCEGGHSWIPDWNNCWRWGAPPPNAGFTVPTADGLGPGEQYCPPGFTWSTAEQRCVFGECPEGQLLSVSQQQCLTNHCPSLSNASFNVRWTHTWGDCVGAYDDWEDDVTDALQWAFKRLDPALRMLEVMIAAPEAYAEYLWHFDYYLGEVIEGTGGGGGASPAAWFGDYDPFVCMLVHATLSTAWHRIVGDLGLHIRCINAGICCSSGGANACTLRLGHGGIIIRLCKSWRAHGPAAQGRIMLHELLHFGQHVFSGKFPDDIRSSQCTAVQESDIGDDSPRCYASPNAEMLARNTHITRSFWYFGKKNIRAAALNADNYVWWLMNRWDKDEFHTCTLPGGSLVP